MESLQRKILSSNRTISDYPDALVRAKFDNALPRENDFQKQLLKSQEEGINRETIVRGTRNRYESPEFEPFRKKKRGLLETRFSWSTDRILTTAVAGAGVMDAVGVVAVTTAGAAAQVTEEPQTHAGNLATSATSTSILAQVPRTAVPALQEEGTRHLLL